MTRACPLVVSALSCLLTAVTVHAAAPAKPGKPGVAATTTATTEAPPAVAEPPASEPAAPTEEVPAEPIATPDEPATEPEPAADAVDPSAVAALQAQARELRDALFKARGRVSLVASKLFTTRVGLQLRSNLERFYEVTDLTLRVDGAPVYVQAKGLPQTEGNLFEVFAAPGSHELAVSANLVARRDATYKLRIDYAIWFAVDTDMVVSTKLLLRETGDMWRFAQKRRGHSDLRVRLRAKSKSTAKRGAASARASGSVSTKGKAP